MNDPKRLLAGEAEPNELRLLRSASDEGPSADALVQLKQALGLRVLSTDQAPTVGRPPTGSSTVPHAPLALSPAKWLLIAGGSTLVVGALVTLGWTRTHAPAAERSSPATLAPPASAAPEAPHEAAHQPGTTTDALLPSFAGAPASAQSASAQGAASADSAGLTDELQRLEGARTALRRKAPKAALAALDDYDRRHPRGALREEAMALRIEGSLALGARAEARQLAAAFLRDYPGSVHGARLRAQLAPISARASEGARRRADAD